MTPAKAGVRSLAAAAIGYLGMVSAAIAGPVSDYDVRIEADFSFVIAPPGGLFALTPLFPQYSHSETGDAVLDPDNTVSEGPPGPGPFSAILDLHVSGTGTGSSSADGSVSFTIGPPPPVQPGFVTPDAVDAFIFIVHQNELVTTNSFNPASTPGGFAISSFTFGGPTPVGGSVMAVACATAGVTGQVADACYSATGTVTVTLSGSVSGEAFTPAVPEPATLALLGAGLAGLAATRRRKLN